MSNSTRRRVISLAAVAALLVTGLAAAPIVSKPEDVGMSAERLARIHPA